MINNDFTRKREYLLASVAQEIELNKSRKEKMESGYNSVHTYLDGTPFFSRLNFDVYAQGSNRTGTTTKPINEEDYDLDIVLHVYDFEGRYSPQEIYSELLKALKAHGVYKDKIQEKSRCIRLNFDDDFHMDILPGCCRDVNDKNLILIASKDEKNKLSLSNPRGLADWFKVQSKKTETWLLREHFNAVNKKLITAKAEVEPLDKDLYLKTPLQRAVQLIKRRRDLYFQGKDYSTSSIVLTVLLARHYNGEKTIFEAIDNTLSSINSEYQRITKANKRFEISNPVLNSEILNDSWETEHFNSFYSFISDFHDKWQELKDQLDGKKYIELFGEGVYKKAFQSFVKNESRLDPNNKLLKSLNLVAGGGAFVDRKGSINSNNGVKNENYHNYGGKID